MPPQKLLFACRFFDLPKNSGQIKAAAFAGAKLRLEHRKSAGGFPQTDCSWLARWAPLALRRRLAPGLPGELLFRIAEYNKSNIFSSINCACARWDALKVQFRIVTSQERITAAPPGCPHKTSARAFARALVCLVIRLFALCRCVEIHGNVPPCGRKLFFRQVLVRISFVVLL